MIWVILYYLVAGRVYSDYALCHSQECARKVVVAAAADPVIYRYEVLRKDDELPPFQRFPADYDVWKNL